jgi:hypothetical protein
LNRGLISSHNGEELKVKKMEKLVSIKIHFDKVEKGFSETLTVRPLDENTYLVEETPALQIVGFKDIIEATAQEDGSLYYQRTVEKSNFQTFNYLLSKKVTESDLLKGLLAKILAEKGYWEILLGGLLFVYLPKGSALEVGQELDKIIATF